MAYLFDVFRLDTDRRRLTAGGADLDIPPKAFDLLAYLVAHRDRVVPKSELMAQFWGADTSEAALQKAVSQIRKTLSVSPAGQAAVQTAYGRGFRFDLPVSDGTGQLQERVVQTVLSTQDTPRARQILATAGAEIRLENAVLSAWFDAALPLEDVSRLALHAALLLAENGRASALATQHTDAPMPRPPSTGITLDATTRAQLGDEVTTEPSGAGFVLLGSDAPRSGVPHRAAVRRARFVGRTAELAFLRALESRAHDSGQAVLLSGPPGIGKSRLLAEFVAASPLPRQRIDCLPALQNAPLAPVQGLCRALFPEPPADLLADPVDAALFALLYSGETRDPILDSLSDLQRAQRQNALFVALMRAASLPDGLMLTIEDVHWLDASSQSLIEALVQGISDSRLCLVMTTRPRPGASLSDTVLPLSPLVSADSHALLRDAALWPDLDAAAAEGLVQRAAGNPFFIEELALAAKAGADPLEELPQTVHAVISRRIQSLPPEDRHLLYVAAVIGPPAQAGLVAQVAGIEDAGAGLARLVQRDFLREDLGGHVFRHMLIRDTAYEMLHPAERARLHGRIATQLEIEGAAPDSLAYHFEKAGVPERALPYWRDASRLALRRAARTEAVRFARNGLALCGPDTPADLELELQICLAPALTALKGFGAEDVGQAYARAHALLGPKTPGKIVVRVLVGLWIHTWVRGRLSESLGHANTILALSERAPDPALRLQAFAGLGQVQFHKGDLDTALENLTQGLAAIDGAKLSIPARNAATSCAAYRAWVLALQGHAAQARDALDLSRTYAGTDNPFAEAIHHALGCDLLMSLRDTEQCRAYADRAIAVSREHGFAFWLGTGLVMRGWALGRQQAFDLAFEALDEGINVFEATDAGVQLANWYGLKAEVLFGAGMLEDGWQAARHALTCADQAEDLWFTPRIHAITARLAQALGRDEAGYHRAQATTLARRFGMAEDAILFT